MGHEEKWMLDMPYWTPADPRDKERVIQDILGYQRVPVQTEEGLCFD